MITEKIIPLTIGLPKSYRDFLRRMALEESMKNPEHTVTVSEMGREIMCEYLDNLLAKKRQLDRNETGSGKEPE